jgi:hypothetical protein
MQSSKRVFSSVLVIRVAAVAALALAGLVRGTAVAQTAPAAAPAPAPSASAAAVSDPCLSLSSLVSRPTVTTSPCAVKFGDLLIESGYTNATTSGMGANSTVTYPQANLRVGLGHNLEFDLNPESLARYSGTPPVNGTTDSSIGFKYEIGYTSKMTYGINAAYTLATGSAPFSGFGDGIVANVNATLTLSPSLGVFSTLGYTEQSAGSLTVPARYHAIAPSFGASLSLPQSVNYFIEAFNQSSTGVGLGGRYGFDTGFQRSFGSRLQLDVNYYDYFAVQNGGHLHSVGFGASYLIGP